MAGESDRSEPGFVIEPVVVLALMAGLLVAHVVGSAEALGLRDRLLLGALFGLVYGGAGVLVAAVTVAAFAGFRRRRPPRVAAGFTAIVGVVPCVLFVLASALDGARVRRALPDAPLATPGAAMAPPLLFVGVDGLDLDELMRHGGGATPVLDSLLAAGAVEPLEVRPAAGAAATWTSVATGERPEAHGVRGDTSVRLSGMRGAITGRASLRYGAGALVTLAERVGLAETRAVTAAACRVPRLWDVVDAAGRSAVVVGWPATEGLVLAHGEVVSDVALGGGGGGDARAHAAPARAVAAIDGVPAPALVALLLGAADRGRVDAALAALLAGLGGSANVLLVSVTGEGGSAPGFVLATGAAGDVVLASPRDVHAVALQALGVVEMGQTRAGLR